MVPPLGESVIISSNRTTADDIRPHRRRCVVLGLLSLPLVALLLVSPDALNSRLRSSPSASSVRSSSKAPATLVARANESTPRAPVLAIIADYDNCWDVISQSNPYFKPDKLHHLSVANAKQLIRAVGNIAKGRERVILFVGSERQSVAKDRLLEHNHNNGFALGRDGAYEKWVENNKEQGWELNKALLADGSEPFSAWENVSKTFEELPTRELKLKVVDNSLRQLQGLGPVDVYFFESYEENVDYVRARALIPADINFYSVFYDHYTFSVSFASRPPLEAKDQSGRLSKLDH